MGPRAGPSGLIDRYLYYNQDPGPQYNYLMPQFTVHVDKLVLYSSEVNNLLTSTRKCLTLRPVLLPHSVFHNR